MEPKLKILHLEDLQSDYELMLMQLNTSKMQFENLVVDTKAEFISALQKFTPDIILADHSLTTFNSMEALKIVKQSNRDIPFLLVTTAASDELVNNLLVEGAKGYILKDNLAGLPGAINKALDKDFFKVEEDSVTETIFLEEKMYDLQMLEQMDDNDYLLEILSIFLDETPRELKEMHKAALSNKLSIVSAKAHKLKSSSGLLEANKLTKILAQLEQDVRSESVCSEIVKLVEAAQCEYKKIENALQAHVKNILQ
jgi:HPt (histidine-containing phosphotransfer) domain-containing protein/FixJ family two-component response regulator